MAFHVAHQRQAIGKAAVRHRVIADQDVAGRALQAVDQLIGAVGLGDNREPGAGGRTQGHFGAHQHHGVIVGKNDAWRVQPVAPARFRYVAAEDFSSRVQRLRRVHAVSRQGQMTCRTPQSARFKTTESNLAPVP
ncbi:hypothetical protein D3C78_1372620 [compost metagenome]